MSGWLPDDREVFVLRVVEGLGTCEVAECLGVSDVVKTRLSRRRAALRQRLVGRTGAPEAFRFYRSRCDRVVAPVPKGLLDSRRQPRDVDWHQICHVALPGSYLASPSHSGQRCSR